MTTHFRKALGWTMAAGLLLAPVLLTVSPVYAQKSKNNENSNMRSVEGVVQGEGDAPIVGAVVQVKDLKSLQVRSYITQANGTFQFQNLNTGVDYELKADYKGASSPVRTLSTFDGRRNAVINLKIETK